MGMNQRDEELQRLAELKEKWARDESSALRSAREEAKEEIAKKMKEKGMKLEDIQELTGLTIKEIEKL